MGINIDNINITFRQMLTKARAGNGPNRLSLVFTTKKQPVRYEDIANLISQDTNDHVFLPDTCFFTAHEVPTAFWDAVKSKRIAISTPVYHELEDWRRNPFYNRCVAGPISDVINSEGPPIVPADGPEWGKHWGLAHQYYATLLSSRKDRVIELITDFRDQNQRDPDKVELHRMIKLLGEDRDVKLLLKAAEAGRGPNWWTDEALVVSALHIALFSGTPTSVLTRDKDVLDQFERLATLVSHHYQSYLFARSYDKYKERYKVQQMPDDDLLNRFFVAKSSILVQKPVPPDDFVNWLLPKSYSPVKVSCVLFGGGVNELTIEVLTYTAERDMAHLMDTKGRTLGRNCDLSCGRNCYVTGFPVTVEEPRHKVIIAEDRWLPGPETPMQWSVLDRAHARFADTVYTWPAP